MKENINYINNLFENIPDLTTRNIKINKYTTVYLFFLDSLCSQDKINDYILKCLVNKKIVKSITKLTYGSNYKEIKKNDIEYYLYEGFSILLIKDKIYVVETKANITRSISPSENESSMKGPKESFTENIQTNLGLIKRRIKSSSLKTRDYNIGRLSLNSLKILYIDNICKKELYEKVITIINNIDTDIVNDTESLIPYFTNKLFPTIITTERPDRCADSLANGKIVIIMDNSPNALILPAFLVDVINPYTDKYSNNININFTKIIRFICFFFTALIPAFYIAIINYNQETLPSSLIVNFASQRNIVPFPAIIECIIMLILCEILRESDLRFPNKYGSAASILGALVLGNAAVDAGLVSPIMIIITSFTYISSLIFAEIEISNALRYYRFFSLILSCLLGLYGFLISLLLLVINLCNTTFLDYPYTFPISPYDKAYFNETVLKQKNKKRSKLLSNNIIKEKI